MSTRSARRGRWLPGLLIAIGIPVMGSVVAGCDSPAPAPSAVSSEPTPSESPTDLLANATANPSAMVGQMSPEMPALLATLPEGSTILVSEANAHDDSIVEASLSFTTTASVDDVVGFYDAALAAGGFGPNDSTQTQPAGTRVRIYLTQSGNEYLSLAIVDSGDARQVTIGGELRTNATPAAE